MIKSCTCQFTEKVYHLKINYNDDDYFFIVKTLDIHFRDDLKKPLVTSIKRGCSYWDCCKRLKNSDKKKIKNIINNYFYK